MDRLQEEKALEDDQCLQSLEEKISLYFRENSDHFSDHLPSEEIPGDYDEDDESESSVSHDSLQRTEFWQSKEAILQEIVDHSNLMCSKLRREVKKALEMARETLEFCHCTKLQSSKACLSCLRREVVNLLCDKGLNAAICISKWKSSPNILGGKHEFIDVIIRTTRRSKETRLLIELEFQAEFEMAKACDEYRNLTKLIPEFFVGKPEHLNAILRIVCDAAKRSMDEKKLHMGPWRKRSFMQMKWSGSSRTLSSSFSSSSSSSSSCQNQTSDEESVSSGQIEMPTNYLQFSTSTAVLVT